MKEKHCLNTVNYSKIVTCIFAFVTISDFCLNRNRAKRYSFTILNLVFLLLKTTLDCVARILLFSTWLYVQNKGQFSSAMTVIAYYSTFMILVLFNGLCNRNQIWWTRRNITGIL